MTHTTVFLKLCFEELKILFHSLAGVLCLDSLSFNSKHPRFYTPKKMSATALEIISLERMKEELRIDQTESSQDDMITAHIKSAVSFVSKEIGLPLVDVSEIFYAIPDGPQSPIGIPTAKRAAVKELEQIRYYDQDGDFSAEPNQTVSGSFLFFQTMLLNPPSTGWPEIKPRSSFEIKIKRGVNITDSNKALEVACVLVARALYDQDVTYRPTSSFYQLIRPFILFYE